MWRIKKLFPNGVTYEEIKKILKKSTKDDDKFNFFDYAQKQDNEFIRKVIRGDWPSKLAVWSEREIGEKIDLSDILPSFEIAVLSTINIPKTQQFRRWRDNFIDSILKDNPQSLSDELPYFKPGSKQTKMSKIMELYWGGFENKIDLLKFQNHEGLRNYFGTEDIKYMYKIIQKSRSFSRYPVKMKKEDIGDLISYTLLKKDGIWPNPLLDNVLDELDKIYHKANELFERDMTNTEVKNILGYSKLPDDIRGDFFRILFDTSLTVYELLSCDIGDYDHNNREMSIRIINFNKGDTEKNNSKSKKIKLFDNSCRMINSTIGDCENKQRPIFYNQDGYGSRWDPGYINLILWDIKFEDIKKRIEKLYHKKIDTECLYRCQFLHSFRKENEEKEKLNLYKICEEVFENI